MRIALLAVVVAGCAGAGDGLPTDSDEVSADVTSDAATELSVRTGDTTVWVARAVQRVGDAFVLHGRTSRTLTDGRAFVFDDVYGDFTRPSPRTFEVKYQVDTANTLSDGVDQFVGLQFVHSAGRPDGLTARAVVTPRLSHFAGSTKIYLTAALAPVVVAGVTVYRISGHTYDPNTDVNGWIDGDLAPVQRFDDRAFALDLTPAQVYALSAGSTLRFSAMFSTGGVEKTATLGLELAKLGLTAGDAYAVWPHPTCTTALKSCLTHLPDGALDLASCGDAFHVTTCQGQVGVTVDDVAFQAALHDTDTVLATTAAHADAVALAGADHADAFLFGAKQTVEDRFQHLFGRWFMSATARSATLAAARTDGLDAAYARPLDLVPAHTAIVGNAAAMQQVAADAVLAELAAMDFLHGELARSLQQLVHDAHAQHVADIATFRTSIAAEPYPGTPAWDVYVGSWLGLHTEVVIEHATGHVVRTLVEID